MEHPIIRRLTTAGLAFLAVPTTARVLGAKKATRSKKETLFNHELDIHYSGCDYELIFSFKHDDDLPVGNETTCTSESTAPDGVPYLAPREFDFPFPQKIYDETGFASLSLDFQACGHPPMDIFNIAHYDMHFYTDPAKVRNKRVCDLIPEAPICDFNPGRQMSSSGRAFFNIATTWELNTTYAPTDIPANMPQGFTCDPESAIPLSGIHCWDFNTNPATMTSWTDPVFIMGSYDAKIAFWEPMAPLSFVTGSSDNHFKQEIAYEGQTVDTLPEEYIIEYETAKGRTTVTLKGKKSSCGV